MENNKLVNLDALDKIAKELRKKALVDISQQEEEIEKVRDMFGGKSFRYVLQEEYDNLSKEEKNDPGIVWIITDAEEPISKEYVDEEVAKINDMLQHMDEGIKTELDKKSNILNYSDHTLNGTETYNNLEKIITIDSGSETIYTINKPINLVRGTICSIEVKFSDNTNLLLQGEVASTVLTQKEVNFIQIISSETAGLIVIDKAKYSIGDNDSLTPEYDDNVSSLLVIHPNANNVISLTITKPTTFEINNSFFEDYQFVNDAEKENWNNKADKSEIPTKTSQLTNDSGFITSIPSEYVTNNELLETLIPYGQELSEIYDLIETDYARKDELFSGDYNDLSNKPEIPSIEGLATEELVNNLNNNVTESINEINTELETKASTEFVNDMLSGLRLVQMTQSEYDALEVKDSNTLYIII